MYQQAIKHFKEVDPILYGLTKKVETEEVSPSQNLFASLCREIIGQQLSGKVARVIFARFQELFPKHTMQPKFLLEISNQTLRDAGMSWNKVKFLKDLAEKVNSKKLDLESLRALDNESIVEELVKVKGVGPWTAEMFLMFALGREDIFSPGDLGLKNAIKKWYNLEKPTPNDLLEISRKWSPYRTYASLILWNSLDNLNILK